MQITTQSDRPALTACGFYKTRGEKRTKHDSHMGEEHSYRRKIRRMLETNQWRII